MTPVRSAVRTRRRIAVMQPYFLPYAGYFRLLAGADCFVLLDCVQFNRRGRVHRVQVPGHRQDTEWLTLPLARHPREVLIRDVAFAADARASFDARLRRHARLLAGNGSAAHRLRAYLEQPLGSVTGFVEQGIRLVSEILELGSPIVRSSELAVPNCVRGQQRIIAIVRALGGTEYVNAPGGRQLYDPEAFARAGLRLSFLSPYEGRYPFLLPALASADPADIREDVLQHLRFSDA